MGHWTPTGIEPTDYDDDDDDSDSHRVNPFKLHSEHGRPERVLHDASMHHGQNRGKQKTRKLHKEHTN